MNALKTVFCYRVTAMSSFGESHGEKACTGVFDVPDPPKAVKAKPAEDAIDLRWKDRSANEDGFVVTMKKKRLWPEIAEVDASETTLTVGGLKAGRRYCFRVVAFNSAGESKARKRCARAGSQAPLTAAKTSEEQLTALGGVGPAGEVGRPLFLVLSLSILQRIPWNHQRIKKIPSLAGWIHSTPLPVTTCGFEKLMVIGQPGRSGRFV